MNTEKIELTFRFNPQTENHKYQKMIDQLVTEGWVYTSREVVGYNDEEPNLIRVHLYRVVSE